MSKIEKDSLLHIAICSKIMDANECDSNGFTPIDLACRLFDTEILDILLGCKARIITDGPEFLIQFLVGKLDPIKHTNVNFADNNLQAGNILKKLISVKIIHHSSLTKYTMRLLVYDRIEILRTITECYPDFLTVRYANNNGCSLLNISISMNHSEFALYLLDKIPCNDIKNDRTNDGREY